MPTLIRKPRAGLSLQLRTLDVSITHNQNCFDFPVHLHNGPNSPCMCSPNKQRKNKQQKEKIKQRTKCELVCVRERKTKREKDKDRRANLLSSCATFAQSIFSTKSCLFPLTTHNQAMKTAYIRQAYFSILKRQIQVQIMFRKNFAR